MYDTPYFLTAVTCTARAVMQLSPHALERGDATSTVISVVDL